MDKPLYSIQTVYNLYRDNQGCLRCGNKIEIPVAEPVKRMGGDVAVTVIPATAIVLENTPNEHLDEFKFLFETNEGVIVEPIVIEDLIYSETKLYLLTLPRGTTGVKNARVTSSDMTPIQNDLLFDIMKAPYNYENYIFSVIFTTLGNVVQTFNGQIRALRTEVSELDARVIALENKAGG